MPQYNAENIKNQFAKSGSSISYCRGLENKSYMCIKIETKQSFQTTAI